MSGPTENPKKTITVIWPDGRESEHSYDAHGWLIPGEWYELWQGRGSGGLMRKVEAKVVDVKGNTVWVELPKLEAPPYDHDPYDYGMCW